MAVWAFEKLPAMPPDMGVNIINFKVK